MPRITDVVKYLIIVNVVMYFGTLMLMGSPDIRQADTLSYTGRYMLAMYYPLSDFFRPYQLITHMFMHADPMHLFFNMYGLYIFGPALETRWGSKRFLNFYLLCGVGAVAIYLGVKWYEIQYMGEQMSNIPMLGASGAVFGVLAAFGLKFPKIELRLLFPPIALQARYFVLIYVAIELFLGVGRISSGVAHWAHIGGALFGFLLVKLYERQGA